jgi:hypothetical protein
MISRTDARILRGPAIVTFNGVTFWVKDEIKINTRYDLFEIVVSGLGTLDKRVQQIVTEITFTPAGEIEGTTPASVFEVLYPHTACRPGASAMPSTDKSVVVWPINGKEKLTYSSGFVSKMPDLLLSAVKTVMGQVTLTCIGTDNQAWSNAAHLFSLADAAFTDTSLTLASILTVPYSAALGALSDPWASIQTKDGWTLSFDVGIEPEGVDDTGLFDWLYNGNASVSVKCKPIGIKVADLHGLMKLQGAGVARGMSILDKAQTLVITGGASNPKATIYGCTLQTAQHAYAIGDRVPDLEFRTLRTLNAGALVDLFKLEVNAA